MAEVKIIVLQSGEQIIANLTEDGDLAHIENPFRLIPRPDGLAFQQWILGTAEKKYTIERVFIVTRATPTNEIIDTYTKNTSIIKAPPMAVGGIKLLK